MFEEEAVGKCQELEGRQWDMRTKNEKVKCVVDGHSDTAVSAPIRV